MRTLAKWTLLCGFAAFLVVAIAPMARADDDIALFRVDERILVGNVVLDPGTYFIRAYGMASNHVFVRVSSSDQTQSYAMVLAQQVVHSELDQITTSNYLVSEGSGPSRLRTWEVAGKGISYLFVSSKDVPQQVAGTRKVIPVLAASR